MIGADARYAKAISERRMHISQYFLLLCFLYQRIIFGFIYCDQAWLIRTREEQDRKTSGL
jgi:hypothetical protein